MKPFVPARPLSGGLLALRGVARGAIVGVGSSAVAALLSALGAAREGQRALPASGLAMAAVWRPSGIGDWIQLVAIRT